LSSLRKLNAAPVLCMSVRFSPGSTGTASYRFSRLLARILVIWSSTTTKPESHSQRMSPPSGEAARFAAAFNVLHAPAADVRMLRVCADVFAMMPAAHALGMGGRPHLHPDLVLAAQGNVRCVFRRRGD